MMCVLLQLRFYSLNIHIIILPVMLLENGLEEMPSDGSVFKQPSAWVLRFVFQFCAVV